jgi:hypothetical protein
MPLVINTTCYDLAVSVRAVGVAWGQQALRAGAHTVPKRVETPHLAPTRMHAWNAIISRQRCGWALLQRPVVYFGKVAQPRQPIKNSSVRHVYNHGYGPPPSPSSLGS